MAAPDRLLLSALRTPTGPVGFWNEPGYEGYRSVRDPLPEDHPALGAWERLAGPREPSQEALVDALRYLLLTLPTPDSPKTSLLRVPGPNPPPQATAAHPRGFRGTRRQPPAPPRPALDLRLVVCDPRGPAAMLAAWDLWREEAVEVLVREGLPADRLEEGVDPGVAARFGPEAREAPLDLLHELGGENLPRLLRLWWALDLPGQPGLRAAAARLVAVDPQALAWLDFTATLPPGQREGWLVAAAGKAPWRRPPPSLDLAAGSGNPRGFLGAWSQGIPEAWLRLALDIGQEPGDVWWSPPLPDAPPVDSSILARALGEGRHPLDATPARLLAGLQESPALPRLLNSLPWEKMSSAARAELTAELTWRGRDEAPLEILAGLAPELGAWLSDVPEEVVSRRVDALASLVDDAPEECLQHHRASLPEALFRMEARDLPQPGVLLAVLLRLETLPSLPDAVAAAYRRACRRDNDARLVLAGLEGLGRHAPDFLAETLPRARRAFFKTCRDLGCLNPARLRRFLEDLEDPARLEPALREELNRNLGLEDREEGAWHALRLLASVSGNRRALRSALRAYAEGDRDYALRHPISEAWFRRHPAVPRELWLEGIHLEREIRYGCLVTFQLERDLLEVLRMGTLASTCLGLGGPCSYSAVAAALDVNKQVVYARDPSGKVLARQVLAISDTDEVARYPIYPRRTSGYLENLFGLYAGRFAEAMGLRMHHPFREPRVELLLAHEWWNDYDVERLSPVLKRLGRRR